MGRIIYGVDLDKPVTSILARDAILKCFFEAHKTVLDEMKEFGKFKSKEELERIEKLEVEILIKKIFDDIDGNFDNPKKEDLIKVCDKLAEFAKNFRNPKIIEKHYSEIQKIINKIE